MRSFLKLSQVLSFFDQNVGVMDPCVVEVSPGTGDEVLENTLDVHVVEDSLDAFHVGSAFVELIGVHDSEFVKVGFLLHLLFVSFMSDLVLGNSDPVIVEGSP